MESLKIWAVEDQHGAKITPLETAGQTASEGLLENILTRNPDMLEEGLELVGRQTETAGGTLDLLGVDRDGRLVVFELKRGTLNRDAVAQIIDYASCLDAMDLDSPRPGVRGADYVSRLMLPRPTALPAPPVGGRAAGRGRRRSG